MVKIVVSRFGDTVTIDNLFIEMFLISLPLGKGEKVGTHEICGNDVELRRISMGHYALSCTKCNLRAEFPADLESENELKQYFQLNFTGN